MTDFDLPINTAIVTDDYITVVIELIDQSLGSVGLVFSALAKKYPHNKILYTFTLDDRWKTIIIILAQNRSK